MAGEKLLGPHLMYIKIKIWIQKRKTCWASEMQRLKVHLGPPISCILGSCKVWFKFLCQSGKTPFRQTTIGNMPCKITVMSENFCRAQHNIMYAAHFIYQHDYYVWNVIYLLHNCTCCFEIYQHEYFVWNVIYLLHNCTSIMFCTSKCWLMQSVVSEKYITLFRGEEVN